MGKEKLFIRQCIPLLILILISLPSPTKQEYTLLFPFYLSSPPNIYDVFVRSGQKLFVEVKWNTSDYIDLFLYHPNYNNQIFNPENATARNGSSQGAITLGLDVKDDATVVIRVSIDTAYFMEYEIRWEVDGKEISRQPITTVDSDRARTVAPFYIAKAYNVRVEVEVNSSLPIYLYESLSNYSDPTEALASNTTTASNRKVFIIQALPRGFYFVAVANSGTEGYQYSKIFIYIDCPKSYVWTFDEHQCVIGCEDNYQFAERRKDGSLDQCVCQDGYSWQKADKICAGKEEEKSNVVGIAVGASLGSLAFIALIVTLILFWKKKFCFKPKQTDSPAEPENPNIGEGPEVANPYLADNVRQSERKIKAGAPYIVP